ncbi:MAG: hypothetical protein ACXVEX_13665, partial [Actinomycetota bacterium]
MNALLSGSRVLVEYSHVSLPLLVVSRSANGGALLFGERHSVASVGVEVSAQTVESTPSNDDDSSEDRDGN